MYRPAPWMCADFWNVSFQPVKEVRRTRALACQRRERTIAGRKACPTTTTAQKASGLPRGMKAARSDRHPSADVTWDVLPAGRPAAKTSLRCPAPPCFRVAPVGVSSPKSPTDECPSAAPHKHQRGKCPGTVDQADDSAPRAISPDCFSPGAAGTVTDVPGGSGSSVYTSSHARNISSIGSLP